MTANLLQPGQTQIRHLRSNLQPKTSKSSVRVGQRRSRQNFLGLSLLVGVGIQGCEDRASASSNILNANPGSGEALSSPAPQHWLWSCLCFQRNRAGGYERVQLSWGGAGGGDSWLDWWVLALEMLGCAPIWFNRWKRGKAALEEPAGRKRREGDMYQTHPSQHSCLSLAMPTAPATQPSCFLPAATTTPTCGRPSFPFPNKSTPLLFGAARKSTRTPPGEHPEDPSLPRPPFPSPDSRFSSTRDGRNGFKRSASERRPRNQPLAPTRP